MIRRRRRTREKKKAVGGKRRKRGMEEERGEGTRRKTVQRSKRASKVQRWEQNGEQEMGTCTASFFLSNRMARKEWTGNQMLQKTSPHQNRCGQE